MPPAPLLHLGDAAVISDPFALIKASPPPFRKIRRQRTLTCPPELLSKDAIEETKPTELVTTKENRVNKLQRRKSSASIHEKPALIELERSRTVSELITATKITAANRVAMFLNSSSEKKTASDPTKSSLPVPQRTDFWNASYELPEILPSKKVVEILDTVPEKVMLFSRRTSLQDNQEFLSLDIRAPTPPSTSSSVSEDLIPIERQLRGRGRRMSSPATIDCVQQFTSYELAPPELYPKLKETAMLRRQSLPHNTSIPSRPKRRFSVDLPRIRKDGQKDAQIICSQPMLQKNYDRFL